MGPNKQGLTRLSGRTLVALSLVAAMMFPVGKPATAANAEGTGSRLAWDQPGSRLRLPNGWTLTTTAGPIIEIRDRLNRLLGVMELGNYVLDGELARASTRSSVMRVLRQRAARFHEVVGRDRADLGAGYSYEPGSTKRVRWGDVRAVRYRARVEDANGQSVERILGYQALHRGHLWILSVNGRGDGRPTDGEDLLSIQEHAILAGYLAGVLKSSPLPEAGTAIEDGIVAGTEGGLDGGRLWLIWNGSKQRIYQARGMAVEETANYPRGVRTAHVIVNAQRTGSEFVLVPADGPGARLHLIVGGLLHEVVVTHVKTSVVQALPTLGPPLLDRLRLPTS